VSTCETNSVLTVNHNFRKVQLITVVIVAIVPDNIFDVLLLYSLYRFFVEFRRSECAAGSKSWESREKYASRVPRFFTHAGHDQKVQVRGSIFVSAWQDIVTQKFFLARLWYGHFPESTSSCDHIGDTSVTNRAPKKSQFSEKLLSVLRDRSTVENRGEILGKMFYWNVIAGHVFRFNFETFVKIVILCGN